MRKFVLSALAVAALAVASPVAAQEMGKDFEGTMQVVDLTCKVGMDLSGESHRQCAQMCADGGLPLGLLDSEGNLYIAAGPGMPAPSQQEVLHPHAERDVKVKGKIMKRNGMNMIVVQSVEGA